MRNVICRRGDGDGSGGSAVGLRHVGADFRGCEVRIGGGPELGYGAGYKKKDPACPTIIEGVVENGHLQVRVHDAWRGGIVSERRFKAR